MCGCGCGCNCGPGMMVPTTKAEKLKALKEYKEYLDGEAKEVVGRIKELQKAK